MKLKYIFIVCFAFVALSSCKSKKKVAQKQVKKTEKVVTVKEKEIPVKKEPVKKAPEINSTEDYINVYSQVAMDEMRAYKIPASITLAQGILESSSGKSELTRKSNNHFGIKCHKGWTGGKTYHDDDEDNECFRVYKDPRTSYKDHSEFLTTRSRYSKLFELDEDDYVGWAKGLSEAGYATDRRYPAKLVGLIEKYELDKYDAEVLGTDYKKKKAKRKKVTHVVVKGDTLYSISRKYNLSVDELKKLNGLRSNTISIGQSLKVK